MSGAGEKTRLELLNYNFGPRALIPLDAFLRLEFTSKESLQGHLNVRLRSFLDDISMPAAAAVIKRRLRTLVAVKFL